MCVSEESNYLLRLLPKYRRIRGEKYILSRIVKSVPKGSLVEMLFCRSCLLLYVPVVNSVMRCNEDEFVVECNVCHNKNTFKVEDIKGCMSGTARNEEIHRFGYYFE